MQDQKLAPGQNHDSQRAVGSVNGTAQEVEQKEQKNFAKQQQQQHHHQQQQQQQQQQHHQQQQQQQQQQHEQQQEQQVFADPRPTTTMSSAPALNGSGTGALKVENSEGKGVQVLVGSRGLSSESDWSGKVPLTRYSNPHAQVTPSKPQTRTRTHINTQTHTHPPKHTSPTWNLKSNRFEIGSQAHLAIRRVQGFGFWVLG